MDISRVKFNLNEQVEYTSESRGLIKTRYILTGCVLRKNANGYYYDAELQDIRQPKNILIAKLEDVDEIKMEFK